ncbi:cytochrome P450 [Actinocorallia sp. API 0066]|uniref:cytochrome P450 n=1 Tax=Actinocorallia sp. API 0066 TaxID=2896846 RepID=UPI001E5D077B|nr:cytochrome P450 [Actinocorallia sp. API 0066]MCD0448119.1 cytochrome P450 [Actinocorallia sp. API 0066]
MATLAPAPEGTGLKPVPGDPGLPYLGFILQQTRDPIGFARARRAKHGDVSWNNFLGKKVVNLMGPDAVREVLTNKDKAFANGPAWGFFIGPFFERGIMLLDFEEHLHHRRIMQQAFTKSRLVMYLDMMSDETAKGVAGWRPGRFEVLPEMKKLTLDLALEVFVGVSLDPRERDEVNTAFVDAVRAGLSIVRFPVPGLRWSRGLKARKRLERFFHDNIAAKRAHGGDDLFAALCQAETDDGHRFTDEDVVNHMIFALMAAHDTTTITMTSMAYYLAKNPEWQERCREQSRALGKDRVEFADLDALTDLDMVMKEALRLCSPVPGLPRVAVKDTQVLGFHIPEGTMVNLATFTNHYREDFWPDPERFDPERFSPERREDRVHQYAWFPFGGGVHKCIGLHFAGMQVKAILHQVLLNYSWSVPDGYTWPLDMTTLPVPKDGLPVTLERIS